MHSAFDLVLFWFKGVHVGHEEPCGTVSVIQDSLCIHAGTCYDMLLFVASLVSLRGSVGDDYCRTVQVKYTFDEKGDFLPSYDLPLVKTSHLTRLTPEVFFHTQQACTTTQRFMCLH